MTSSPAGSSTGSLPKGTVLVIGAGYVGLTAAACFSHKGLTVICADVDAKKIELLNEGIVSIQEPGLQELVASGLSSGRLQFVNDALLVASQCEFVFLCVQTPLGDDGTTDTTHLLEAAQVGAALPADAIVISKSTVPVGGHEAVVAAIGRDDIGVASNPEFLSQGNAVQDFLNPDRVVIGADDQRTVDRVAALFDWVEAPVITTDLTSAEVAKFAANAFLATKVSFVNELTAVCEAVGANIDDVLTAVGADPRIGDRYLQPGPGWGGSCLPKDTHALVSATRDAGYVFDLLEGAIRANEQQLERVVSKVVGVAGQPDAVIAVLGLTFKAGTDDLRGSPAVEIAQRLVQLGAKLQAFDPALSLKTQNPQTHAKLPQDLAASESLQLCNSVASAALDADVLVVLTEWPEFVDCDWCAIAALMKTAKVVDARNLLDPAKMIENGFSYEGLGRATRRS